jgi:sulfatase modifying factor 1
LTPPNSDTILTGENAPSLVTLPAGRWRLGSSDGLPDEAPVRFVELPAFRAAIAPVSNAEFHRFQLATGHGVLPFQEDDVLSPPGQPVVGVNWFDAAAYLEWLSLDYGLALRLPSEDEREVAARGGLDGQPWPWGEREPEDRPELAEIAGLSRPHEPSAACANAHGLRCMADNVHEWCADWYGPEHGQPSAQTRRSSRGGSWRHHRKFTRVSARSSLPPERRYSDYGFRVFADA